MPVWDTTIASGMVPGGSLSEVAQNAAEAGSPVRIAAATAHEIAFGLAARHDLPRVAKLSGWFEDSIRDGLLSVLPTSASIAVLAGKIRAVRPVAAVRSEGTRRRTKPERRVAWVNDIHIAATAWIHGEPLHTLDAEHFSDLAAALQEMYPGEPPLELRASPL